MRGKRLINQLSFFLRNDPYKRADYLREKNIFASVGEHVSFQPRKIPLYGQLISLGNNVVIASNVSFCTHDGVHSVFNKVARLQPVTEKIGCIKIGNNCFVGANALILYNVNIGDNSIIAAGAVVTKDVPTGEVWGGVPAKCIGQTRDLYEKYKENLRVYIDKENLDEKSVQKMWERFNSSKIGCD